jgi:hypothetical protein
MLLVTPDGDVFAGSNEFGIVGIEAEAASSTSTEPAEQVMPKGYALGQNYPNPFNPVTTIAFDLPATGSVRLAVFDILGREVALLASGSLEAGQHEVCFDAQNLPSGT